MNSNNFVINCTILVLVIILGMAPANAQFARMLSGLKDLTEDDKELMRQTARIDMNEQKVGTRLSWENDESGNYGTVRLLKILQKNGYPCREIVHNFNLKSSQNHRFQFTICNIEGEWKISE